MFAAVTAASGGIKVSLWEKNEKLGKKLFITGKGRCNLTNNCETEALFQNVMTNSKFLYSAFYQFNSRDLMTFFETEGLRLKTERGNRVFPESDKSSDVIRTLERKLKQLGVSVELNRRAEKLIVEENICRGVIDSDGRREKADFVLIATGGLSYGVYRFHRGRLSYGGGGRPYSGNAAAFPCSDGDGGRNGAGN